MIIRIIIYSLLLSAVSYGFGAVQTYNYMKGSEANENDL